MARNARLATASPLEITVYGLPAALAESCVLRQGFGGVTLFSSLACSSQGPLFPECSLCIAILPSLIAFSLREVLFLLCLLAVSSLRISWVGEDDEQLTWLRPTKGAQVRLSPLEEEN
jgi:hypothetical protein